MQESHLFLLIIGLGIVLLMIFFVLLIFNTSRKRVLAEINEKHQQELGFKQRLLRNNVKAQEKERERIARELHDDIGSQLNVVHLNCNLLETSIKNGNNVENQLDQIRSSLNDSIVRIRDLSHGLYPPVLEKFGLQSALQSLIVAINRTGQVRIVLEVGKDWGKLELIEELNLYRLIQELINNTIKHARASTISITSIVDDSTLRIIYKDDGIGFPKELASKEGMGMNNIRTRATLLDASLDIKNGINSGVEIVISMPFKRYQNGTAKKI